MVIERATQLWRLGVAAPLWLLAGIVGGYLVAPGGGLDWAYALWDATHPVVEARAHDVQHEAGAVTLAIRGTKLRACEYLAANAYAVGPDGDMSDANLERVDRAAAKFTRPLGGFDAGRWRIWPTAGAVAVEVAWTYNCAGRVLVDRVARVDVR